MKRNSIIETNCRSKSPLHKAIYSIKCIVTSICSNRRYMQRRSLSWNSGSVFTYSIIIERSLKALSGKSHHERLCWFSLNLIVLTVYSLLTKVVTIFWDEMRFFVLYVRFAIQKPETGCTILAICMNRLRKSGSNTHQNTRTHSAILKLRSKHYVPVQAICLHHQMMYTWCRGRRSPRVIDYVFASQPFRIGNWFQLMTLIIFGVEIVPEPNPISPHIPTASPRRSSSNGKHKFSSAFALDLLPSMRHTHTHKHYHCLIYYLPLFSSWVIEFVGKM